MPGNATVGSTLLDEELRRILMEREQECMKLKAMNTTPPPGKVFFMFENKRNRPRSKSGERERAYVSSARNGSGALHLSRGLSDFCFISPVDRSIVMCALTYFIPCGL
jgi:hypothetical protein